MKKPEKFGKMPKIDNPEISRKMKKTGKWPKMVGNAKTEKFKNAENRQPENWPKNGKMAEKRKARALGGRSVGPSGRSLDPKILCIRIERRFQIQAAPSP